MPISGRTQHVIDKQLLLRDRQGFAFFAIISVYQFQLAHHVVCGILPDESIINSHLKGLMKHVMDDVYRCYLQNLIIDQPVIKSSDVRLLDLAYSLLPKHRAYKAVIHVNVILKCAVLQPAFQIFPQIKEIIDATPFMSDLQKRFYLTMLTERKARILDFSLAALEKRE